MRSVFYMHGSYACNMKSRLRVNEVDGFTQSGYTEHSRAGSARRVLHGNTGFT